MDIFLLKILNFTARADLLNSRIADIENYHVQQFENFHPKIQPRSLPTSKGKALGTRLPKIRYPLDYALSFTKLAWKSTLIKITSC